tara:strand:+ start:137 stop:970 length:834 start_codon:yes stop_codon:yes gene_type:complete
MLPIYQQSTKLLKKYDTKLIILFIFLLFLSVVSIFSANHIRIEKLENVKTEYKESTEKKLDKLSDNDLALEKKLKNYNFQIPKKEKKIDLTDKENLSNPASIKPTPRELIQFMIINRWTGIDSLILVSSSESKGYDVLLRALKEEKNYSDYTFYEKEFGLIVRKTTVDTGKTIMKGNTLPGIISFLYYTGSPIFLLLSIMVIFFLFNSLENFLRYLTDNNLVFICFISNMIATRLFHFGYAPKDSYMFIISILLSIFFLVLLMRFKFQFSSQKNKIN